MKIATAIAGAATLLAAWSAHAGPDLVAFPEGYAEGFTHIVGRDRDNPEQIAEVFANDIAVASTKDGAPLDSGSVLVMEIHKAQLDASEEPVLGDDGRRIKEGLGVIVVMEKRTGWGSEYADDIRNGEWEFAAFSPDGQAVERDFEGCFGCHKPLEDQDFVQTFDEITAK